jgi:hypothetical protein
MKHLRLVGEEGDEEEMEELPEVALDAIHAFLSRSEQARSIKTEDLTGFILVARSKDAYRIMADTNDTDYICSTLDKAKLSIQVREMFTGETDGKN